MITEKTKPYGGAYEKEIEELLIKKGVRYSREQRLDFYLIDFDVYIEVKQYHSDRSLDQLKSQENVILLQGVKAVNFFIDNITKTPIAPF
jgi:hypothetical protein